MCQDYQLPLLGKIPLDPSVSVSAESGKRVDLDIFNRIIGELEKNLEE